MRADHWRAAFTIVVSDLQVDFMELPEQNRIEILMALMAGKTDGKFARIISPSLDRAAS